MSKLVIGIIPARGGSKGVVNKNIRELVGKPLIAYTIEASKNSKMLTHVVVSTDSNEIAEISKKYGASVPFMRPAELATDMAASLPVVQHAVKEVEKIYNCKFDAVVMLQPTCPLRTSAHIDLALNKLFETNADSVVSVTDVGGNHPLRMKRVVAQDRLINYIEQGQEDMRPRQILPPTYIRNGALYITKRDVIMDQNTFIGNDCRAFIMEKSVSVNIDAFEDLLVAEYYLKQMSK